MIRSTRFQMVSLKELRNQKNWPPSTDFRLDESQYEAFRAELCKHPNSGKSRRCGHPSIGVCGERRPRLCRICNRKEVEEIFFGNEDEKDARFIELGDCRHIIEVNGLIQWMKSEPDAAESTSSGNNRSSIQLQHHHSAHKIVEHVHSGQFKRH